MKIFTDAGSRGNPGPAAIAYSIYDSSGRLLKEHAEAIGVATNNVAEYTAIAEALKAASSFGDGEVTCSSDSEIVVKQLKGEYRVKDENLKTLFARVKRIERRFEKVGYKNLRRWSPSIARMDKMVNKCLDENRNRKPKPVAFRKPSTLRSFLPK